MKSNEPLGDAEGPKGQQKAARNAIKGVVAPGGATSPHSTTPHSHWAHPSQLRSAGSSGEDADAFGSDAERVTDEGGDLLDRLRGNAGRALAGDTIAPDVPHDWVGRIFGDDTLGEDVDDQDARGAAPLRATTIKPGEREPAADPGRGAAAIRATRARQVPVPTRSLLDGPDIEPPPDDSTTYALPDSAVTTVLQSLDERECWEEDAKRAMDAAHGRLVADPPDRLAPDGTPTIEQEDPLMPENPAQMSDNPSTAVPARVGSHDQIAPPAMVGATPPPVAAPGSPGWAPPQDRVAMIRALAAATIPGSRITGLPGDPRSTPTPHVHTGWDWAMADRTPIEWRGTPAYALSAAWGGWLGNATVLVPGAVTPGEEAEGRYRCVLLGHGAEPTPGLLPNALTPIASGALLHLVGATGDSTGPHIHVSVGTLVLAPGRKPTFIIDRAYSGDGPEVEAFLRSVARGF